MADQTALIECKGGLNETASELKVGAGEVRRSLNYEQVAEGGYRMLDGTRRWSGSDITPRVDHLTVVEVKPKWQDNENIFDSFAQFEAQSSGTVHTIVLSLPRESSTLVVTERESATADFIAGEQLGAFGERVITDLEPELTEAEQTRIADVVDTFAEGKATQPIGDGEIVLLAAHPYAAQQPTHGGPEQGTQDWLYAVRMSGTDAYVQYAAPFNRTGYWNLSTIINNAQSDMPWHYYSHAFDQTGRHLFIVNGQRWCVAIIENNHPVDIKPPGVLQFPINVTVFQNHLFLAYPNGRILHSDIGDPRTFSAIGGGGELALGEEITGFQILHGDSMAIFGRNSIGILSGTSAADWQLQIHTDAAGAIEGSIQNMPTTIFADQRGVTTLSSSDTYGNFASKTLSQRFHPLFKRIVANNRLFSSINRDKSQYRLYNQDGSGIHLTFTSGALVGGMEVNLRDDITAMVSVRGVDDDVTFFASSDGWVHRMDWGTKMSGKAIDAFLEFPYHHYNSPRQKKRFKQVVFDMIGDPRTQIEVTNSVERGEPLHCDAAEWNVDVRERTKSGYLTALLSRFYQRFRGVVYTEGTGFDQSLLVKGGNHRHIINSITAHYTWRGQKH